MLEVMMNRRVWLVTRDEAQVHRNAGVWPEENLSKQERQVVYVHLICDLRHPGHVPDHHLKRVPLHQAELLGDVLETGGNVFAPLAPLHRGGWAQLVVQGVGEQRLGKLSQKELQTPRQHVDVIATIKPLPIPLWHRKFVKESYSI